MDFIGSVRDGMSAEIFSIEDAEFPSSKIRFQKHVKKYMNIYICITQTDEHNAYTH